MTRIMSPLWRFIGFVLILITAPACSADRLGSNQIELSANLGFSKLTLGNSTFGITETEVDNLHQTDNPLIGEVAFGMTYVIPFKELSASHRLTWFPALRTALYLRYSSHDFFNRTAQGQIEQYQDPRMSNYHYRLSIDSTRLMADVILTLVTHKQMSLFVNGGVGPGWTQVSYSDEPNLGVVGGNLFLFDKTKKGLVSEIGVGLFYHCSNKLKLSVNFLHSNFGTIKTGSEGILDGASASINPARFSLRSNTILFGLYLTP
ncbi:MULTISPECIES: hypothetical protein [unclassified Legionella]|uniref:hypothetical protein n=1 Tax=unclassified Legionella TaxID=2622702 RepID=UPI001055DA11|nr:MULTISPECIES: hypothetical protein [unclassified Legionella]MDI9818445.1 hypothetical protein [Legionella sp. PL877]